MAGVDNSFQVLYTDQIPTTPIRLGQLLVDESVAGAPLKSCTSLSPLTYTTVGIGGAQAALQFEDEGIALGAPGTVNTVDFVGAGVTAARVGDAVTVTIGAGGAGPYVRGSTFVSSAAILAPLSVPLYFPDAATIVSATILTQGGTGSCVVDVRVGTFAAYPTVSSICAGNKPTVAAAVKSTDATLTGWTTAIPANSALVFALESSTVFTTVAIYLKLNP